MLNILTALALAAAEPGPVCAELLPSQFNEVWAVAPPSCPAGLEAACSTLVHEVLDCVAATGVKVMSPGALTAMIDEEAVRTVLGSGDLAQFRRMGGLVPAKYLVVGEVTKAELGARALLRLVRLEDGRIVAGTRLNLTDRGELQSRVAEDGHRVSAGDIKDTTVEVGLRLLADRLAQGYAALPGGVRYKRFAVLDFAELTPRTKEQSMGRVISAELLTRLTKDHDLIMVERARLGQVLQEITLGQLGVLAPERAPELGKMVEADAVVMGSVSEVGDKYLVHAQIIEVETGLTVVAESVSLQAEGLITLASEALVLRTKGGAIYRSLLIPGWGQHYNREDNKAIAFGAAAGVFAVGALATHLLALKADNDYDGRTAGADFDAAASTAQGYMTARTVLLIALGVTWAYNVVDAYLNGVTFDSAVTVGASSSSDLPALVTW